ncbi:hypothetical protein C8A00DRAFT_15730, partial [Chaetomidium leptoderma]
RVDLDKYILEDIPAPETAEEKRRWVNERADIDNFIQANVPDSRIWTVLRSIGWVGIDIDPKKTYSFLKQYF